MSERGQAEELSREKLQQGCNEGHDQAAGHATRVYSIRFAQFKTSLRDAKRTTGFRILQKKP